MYIEKKITMLSTKEWMQYLQYKLSPEREKELLDKTTTDLFLKEAVDSFNNLENRNIAFTSLSYIHDQIEEMTGVSESKITHIDLRNSNSQTFSKQTIIIGIGFLLTLGLGILLYYLSQNGMFDSAANTEETVVAESPMESISSTVDSSAIPLDVIPNSTTSPVAVDTPKPLSTNTVGSASENKKKKSSNSSVSGYSASTSNGTPEVYTSPSQVATTSSNKETEQFYKAQELFKANKVEEAKNILKELKSYDNPKRAQSEKILNTLNNQ